MQAVSLHAACACSLLPVVCGSSTLLMVTGCREFQARVTRQVAAASAVKPEPQSEMFAGDVPERTTLGSLRAHGKNARVAVNRASSSTSHRGYDHCDIQFRTDDTTLLQWWSVAV